MKHNYILIFTKASLTGILGLSLFYYLLLFAVTGDAIHPLSQFILFQPWMSLLILGFGVQSGLYWLMRQGVRFSVDRSEANATAGTSATVSGTAMVACCAHHVADLAPVLGVSGAVLFFTEYQQQFLILGVITNGLGILFMLWHLWGKQSPSVIFASLFIDRPSEARGDRG